MCALFSSLFAGKPAPTGFAAAGFKWVGDTSGVDQLDLKDGKLPKVALHALMGGLAAEAAGGDFRIGALSAGVNEAVVGLLADQYTKMPEEERKRLLVMNSQLVGVLTAAAAGGDAKDLQTGSWVAGSATSYNRLLHDAEKKALTTEAAELEKRLGKPGTDLSWDDLLLLAANAQVDEAENKRLQALLQIYDPQRPEGQHFAESLLIAQQSISRLAAQDIVLIWEDDRPIMADGDEVKAFQSSAKQFQDHGLFNANSKWTQASGNGWAGDVDLVPEAWKQQFGEKKAAIYLREIGQVSSSPEQMNDLVERITVIAKGGVKDVTLDLDIALAMTGAPAVLRALLAKRVSAAMAEAGGAAAGKETLADAGGSLAGKEGTGGGGLSGGLAESSVSSGAKGSAGAESAINQGRLNSQLLAEEVASGHAFQKHVVERKEFADLGINTKNQFQSFVEKIVSNPAIERRQAVDGTVYYLDTSTKTIVIRGQRGEATAFRPDKGGVGWDNYIKSQVPKK